MSIKQLLFFIRRHKTFWLIISLIGFVSVAELSNAWQRFNAPIFNYFNYWQSTKLSNVVVIEADDLLFEHDKLIHTLLSFEPSTIIVVSDPKLTQISHERIFYPRKGNGLCLSNFHSWLGYTVQIDNSLPAACKSLWKILFPKNTLAFSPLLSFSLDFSALPKFNSDRANSNDLLIEQIKGKLVFVTQAHHSFGSPLRAPKLSSEFNPIYLHAYVAHNLLEETFIMPINKHISLLTQLLAVVLLLILYQKVAFSLGIMIASSLSLIWLLLCFITMTSLYVFLPAAQGVMLNFVTLIWVFLSAKWVEEDELKRLMNNIRQKMLGRYLPKSFTEQSTPWDSIIQLINQQLDLDKSIFLARLEGDHRLYEIRAINCHLTDIHEMRRDYERAPYSDAIKAFGTVKISRPFFKALTQSETQYIVPLMYAGDIRGFWAMTITPDEGFNETAFIKNVNRFANQVGELLFHYRVFETQDKTENNLIARLLTLNLAKPLSQQIKHSLNEMEQKLTTLEHVFNQIRSASVLFNLFGQVVQTNHALEQLAKQHHLPVFEMTALDLLCKVSKLDHESAKGKLRYLTLHKGEIYLPVQLDSKQFVLNVRTIESSDEKSSAGEPFEVGGILFEFINLSELLDQIKDESETAKSDQDIQEHNNTESEASN